MTDTTARGTLAATADRRLIRATHHSTRYVLVELVAPPATGERKRPRVNVSFVLDRSGSMSADNKFPLAAEALRAGMGRLAADDRFSVVVFDAEVDVLAPARPADAAAKEAAARALDLVGPRSNTNLCDGWLRGAEQVAVALDDGAVNRVLLLTDGLANEGVTDRAELERRAGELRARGISTSTFGVGSDFDEALLGGMADAGGGAYRYIGTAAEIPALIGAEVGELLETTATGVQLRCSGADGLSVEPLAPYRFEPTSRGGTVALGDLVADQVLRLVLAVHFPLGEVGRETGLEIAVADQTGALAGSTTLTWTFADGAAVDGQPREREVDRLVARTYADRALRQAVGLNRREAWQDAREALLAVARRIRAYAGSDDVLRGIVAELEREAERWSRWQHELDRKLQHSLSSYALKSRQADGSVERRDQGDWRR